MDTRKLVCGLRGDFTVEIILPNDFNKVDAERLKKFIDFEAELEPASLKKKKKKASAKVLPATHSVIDEVTKNKP